MQTLGIRELTAPRIAAAAERKELLGITNAGVLAGVLVPTSQNRVQDLLEQNLTRLVRNVTRGERELALATEASPADDSGLPGPRLTTLDDVLGEETRPTSGQGMKRATLREINGRLLEEAAEQHRTIAVTVGSELAGVIFPVTRAWVERLVEKNLSRVLYNIEMGEKELAGHQFTLLQDLTAQPDEAPPVATSTTDRIRTKTERVRAH